MANINKNEIGYNENTTANALMVQYKRGLAAPMDISEVFTSLESAQFYASSDPIAYAGQSIAVAGDGIKTEIYKITSGGTLVRMIDEEDLASFELPDNLATTDDVDNASNAAVSSAKTYVDGKLEDYATKSYVTDTVAGILTDGEFDLDGYAKVEDVKTSGDAIYNKSVAYTDDAILAVSEEHNWILVEGEPQKVRNWRGSRASYEMLVDNKAVSPWTRYVVIDVINGKEVITEYYGNNQVSDATGQLLPVKNVIASISDITPNPYDRYLVGSDGKGYQIYEYIIDGEYHKWLVKPFDYRYGVRIIEKGLKNYVYLNGVLKTYDDVDCGEF
jgi:hypothetical protein